MYEPSIVSAETASDDTQAQVGGRFFPNGDEDLELTQNNSVEQPVLEKDMDKLFRIPMKVIAAMPSVSWAAPMLLYKSLNKCYDIVLVSTTVNLMIRL